MNIQFSVERKIFLSFIYLLSLKEKTISQISWMYKRICVKVQQIGIFICMVHGKLVGRDNTRSCLINKLFKVVCPPFVNHHF